MNDFDSDELSAKLRTWKVQPRLPDSFQREVWQRIAARQSARDDAFFRRLWQAVSAWLAQPQYALGLIVLSLSLSIGVAHVRAEGTKARHWKTLEARYAASIDPLAMSR